MRAMLGASAVCLAALIAGTAAAEDICEGFGPQTPRDISAPAGSNPVSFAPAPPATALNLCNIHSHANAENKGPGFSVPSNDGKDGFRCNETASLTAAELTDPADGHGAFHGVKPGDTIEVHWVYSSCGVEPGVGLEACLSDDCVDPKLRVEAQVFLLVNDPTALDFRDFDDSRMVNGFIQPQALPAGTGDPVSFLGSTTGPKYDQTTCSPLQVTWSVRPQCARLDIGSLNAWAQENVYYEEHAHGVRLLVTATELLSPIE